MPPAKLLLKARQAHGRGIVEMVVWQLPQPVPPSKYRFKYRLVYIIAGRRVVGYDNELGKGDHRHLGERELAYDFVDAERLVANFMADVKDAG